MEWYEILTLIIGVAGGLLGIAFFAKFQKVVQLLRELGDLLIEVGELSYNAAEVLKDRKVTKAESVLLLKDWQEVSKEFGDVFDVLMELLPANIIKFLFKR